MTWSTFEVSAVAKAFLEGVWHDLSQLGGIQPTRFEPLRRSMEFAIAVLDTVAVQLARKYSEGSYDFDMADWIANAVDVEALKLMIELQPEQQMIDIPLDWAEVYEAFDGGEFDHFGRLKDPVTEFTDPHIRLFLDRIDNPT